MSADFVNGVSQELIDHMNKFWGRRQDTVIHIEGLEGPPHGIRLGAFPQDAQWISQRSFPTNLLRWRADLHGTSDDTNFVTGVKAVLEEHFDPRGRLIITGKSSGGVNALQLCRHLAKNCGFFRLPKLSSFITDDEPKGQFLAANDNTPFTLKVRVDLVCVFDASFDTNQFTRQRVVSSIVRSYANWFQTKDKDNQVHESLVFDASTTGKIMDKNCNVEIPPNIARLGLSSHVFLCKTWGPMQAEPLILEELKTQTPTLTPTIRGGPPGRVAPNVRLER